MEHSASVHEIALARSVFYKLLAKSFHYPTEEVFDYLNNSLSSNTFSQYLFLRNRTATLEKLIEPLHRIVNSIDERQKEILQSEYNRLFAHLGSAKCPPYETEYGFANIFQKTEAMADIAGFYRAYSLEVADENTERVDFIGMELEFMSYLAAHEAYARDHDEVEHLEICCDTQRKFLRDHLGRWITMFTTLVANLTGNQFYLILGKLTQEFVDNEAQRLGVELTKVHGPNQLFTEKPEQFDCRAYDHSQSGGGDTDNTSNPKFDV